MPYQYRLQQIKLKPISTNIVTAVLVLLQVHIFVKSQSYFYCCQQCHVVRLFLKFTIIKLKNSKIENCIVTGAKGYNLLSHPAPK